MRALLKYELDRRWGALIGLVVIAAALLLASCGPSPGVIVDPVTDITDTTAIYHSRADCSGLSGQHFKGQYETRASGSVWNNGQWGSLAAPTADGWHHFTCPGDGIYTLPTQKQTYLMANTDYEVRAHIVADDGSNYYCDADGMCNEGDTFVQRFDTPTVYEDIVAADIGDDDGTDAQASLNANKAHIVLGWDDGTAASDDPGAWNTSYVGQPTLHCGDNGCSGQQFGMNMHCRVSMRTWFPSGGGYWSVLKDDKWGQFGCYVEVDGNRDEKSSGAAARTTFILSPASKRWRNVRQNSGCRIWDSDNNKLECTRFVGPNSPPIG